MGHPSVVIYTINEIMHILAISRLETYPINNLVEVAIADINRESEMSTSYSSYHLLTAYIIAIFLELL